MSGSSSYLSLGSEDQAWASLVRARRAHAWPRRSWFVPSLPAVCMKPTAKVTMQYVYLVRYCSLHVVTRVLRVGSPHNAYTRCYIYLELPQDLVAEVVIACCLPASLDLIRNPTAFGLCGYDDADSQRRSHPSHSTAPQHGVVHWVVKSCTRIYRDSCLQ